jgi:hypothetical protein
MLSRTLLKWTVAGILVAGVPALAATHKTVSPTGTTTKSAHKLTGTSSKAHAHRLTAGKSGKVKNLTSIHRKHSLKHAHHRKASLTSAHKHAAAKLDKGISTGSNM